MSTEVKTVAQVLASFPLPEPQVRNVFSDDISGDGFTADQMCSYAIKVSEAAEARAERAEAALMDNDAPAFSRNAMRAYALAAIAQSASLRWQELAIQCLKDALKDVEAIGVELPRHGIDVLGYFINRLNARQAEPVAEVTGRVDSGCTILALVDLPAMAPEPLDIAQALTQALQVCGIGKGLAGRVESEFQLRLAAASPQSETPK